MSQPQPTGIGPTARWLLLLSTMFGLAAMHTLGHAGVESMAGDVGVRHDSVLAADAAAGAAPMAAGVPACPGDRCPEHGPMNGWSVCLAVLGGLAAVVLLAVLLRVRRARTGRPAARPVRAGRAPRPPPVRAAGLNVASTAVLRI